MIKEYEKKIKLCSNKEKMKDIVREMFKRLEINDIDFNDIVYMDVIPRLEELGVVFDRELNIDYEMVMKEEY